MHARSPAAVADSRGDAHRKLVIAALGVVFGDIGTSPLYAFRECLNPEHGIAVTQANILGLLSLILWSLVLIISIKYVAIVLRADNRGEGGVLALSTLLSSASSNWRLWAPVSAVGVFGAALFFGDGFITPAISVLSAMEGLAVATPRLQHFVVPGAVLILTVLFMVQRRGTGAMGRLFGPVTLVWFSTLALLGIRWIITKPDVVFAINPLYAVHFFIDNGVAGFVTLASVFLAVTGGEALYADMGHFGRPPIRRGWFMIVLPALVLNYFGQGALLLEHPSAISNPFYMMAPGWLLPLLIVLATAATVIASQAVISGVFSITRQALNLGYLPRLRVLHSSEEEIGQVYVPTLNWMLFAGTMTLIVTFQSSSALAGAYGIAISSTMLIDTILVIMLLRVRQEPHRRLVMAVLGLIVAVEAAFFLLEPAEVRRRRLAADRRGGARVHTDDDVAGRTAHAELAGRERADAGARLSRADRARAAASGRGYGGLSRERGRRHTARVAEQPALQPRPAPAQRAAHVRAAGGAVRGRRESRGDPGHRRGLVPHHRALRLHGDARTSSPPCAPPRKPACRTSRNRPCTSSAARIRCSPSAPACRCGASGCSHSWAATASSPRFISACRVTGCSK